jgi:hypothetical protein
MSTHDIYFCLLNREFFMVFKLRKFIISKVCILEQNVELLNF